jgi:hypothetical protein
MIRVDGCAVSIQSRNHQHDDRVPQTCNALKSFGDSIRYRLCNHRLCCVLSKRTIELSDWRAQSDFVFWEAYDLRHSAVYTF